MCVFVITDSVHTTHDINIDNSITTYAYNSPTQQNAIDTTIDHNIRTLRGFVSHTHSHNCMLIWLITLIELTRHMLHKFNTHILWYHKLWLCLCASRPIHRTQPAPHRCLYYTMHGPWAMGHVPWSMFHDPWSMGNEQCIMGNWPCAVGHVQLVMCNVPWAMWVVHGARCWSHMCIVTCQHCNAIMCNVPCVMWDGQLAIGHAQLTMCHVPLAMCHGLCAMGHVPLAIGHWAMDYVKSAMGHCPWAMCHVPCAMCHGARHMGHGPRAMCHVPWAMGHVPCAMCHGPWAMGHGVMWLGALGSVLVPNEY